MSANLDLVRSIYADWERGEFTSIDWADSEIVFVAVGGLEVDWESKGLAGMARFVREVFGEMEHWRDDAEEYRELTDGRVLVLDRLSGRGRASGVDLEQTPKRAARVFEIHNGKVTSLVAYWDRDRALADLGLEE